MCLTQQRSFITVLGSARGGSLWVDTVEFHIVDNPFPVTHPSPAQSRKSGATAFQPPLVPSNLDFEDTDQILN
jgi:hypothetical protein